MPPQFEIIWQAPEYEHRPKSAFWYWGSIAVAVLMIGVAVWQKNFLFGFFVAGAEILIIIWGNRPPQTATFRLTPKGLWINNREFHSFADFKGFSILEEELAEEARAWRDTVLHLKKVVRPTLHIKFPAHRIEELERTLQPILPRLLYEEPLIETMERFFGF